MLMHCYPYPLYKVKIHHFASDDLRQVKRRAGPGGSASGDVPIQILCACQPTVPLLLGAALRSHVGIRIDAVGAVVAENIDLLAVVIEAGDEEQRSPLK